MAKLNQLLTLESILLTYDRKRIEDTRDTYIRGQVVKDLVDDIIARLTRHLESKTRLSCSNVLVANFSTMTQCDHWLKSELFLDLPKEACKQLEKKIREMVDLMKALWLKIIKVEDEYAERFFARLNRKCQKCRATDYDVWKARQPRLTIKKLVEYQVGLTARMLRKCILKYEDMPSGEEMLEVNKEMLKLKLKDGEELTGDFLVDCAKLRRFSYWDGDMFKIDYELFRDYIFRVICLLSNDQRIAMYEYDVQMKQIHQDIMAIKKADQNSKATEAEEKLNLFAPAKNIKVMLQQGTFEAMRTDKKYNHQWIEQFVDDLMASEWGVVIAREWKVNSKRVKLVCKIVGTLKDAKVLKGPYQNLASMFEQEELPPATLARYMGLGKDEPYFDWICEYVEG